MSNVKSHSLYTLYIHHTRIFVVCIKSFFVLFFFIIKTRDRKVERKKENLSQIMSSIPLETVRTEDYIEYYLFPDLKSNAAPVESVLETVIQQINTIADRFCEKYIWHKDGFRVSPRYSNASLLMENQLDNCGVYCSTNYFGCSNSLFGLFELFVENIFFIDVNYRRATSPHLRDYSFRREYSR